jgi:hypothetical protein
VPRVYRSAARLQIFLAMCCWRASSPSTRIMHSSMVGQQQIVPPIQPHARGRQARKQMAWAYARLCDATPWRGASSSLGSCHRQLVRQTKLFLQSSRAQELVQQAQDRYLAC